MKVAELVGVLGFEFDDKDLKKFDAGMKTAVKTVTIATTAMAALAAGTFAFVSKIAQTNDEIGKMSERLGVSTEELQSWGFAAELGGSSSEAMASSLQNVSTNLSQAARGIGAGVEVFGILGISATDATGKVKNANVAMEEIADRVSNLGTQAEKLEFLQKLGISADLLLTLDQGSAALRRQRLEAKELGFVLDKNATKTAGDFNNALLKVMKIIQGVASAIATKLMPPITRMMDTFKQLFINNKELLKQNITAFVENLGKAFNFVWNIAKRVANIVTVIVNAFGGWKNAIGLVTVALVAMNATALFIPLVFLAIGAAIFLMVEDIVAFANGRESALQDLIDIFPQIEAPIRAVIDLLALSAKGWGLVLTDGAAALEGLGILIEQNPSEPIQNAMKWVTDLIDKFSEIKASIAEGFSSSIEATTNFLGIGDSPTPAVKSNSNSAVTTNTVNAEIIVNGANQDPKAIAINVREQVQKALSDVTTQTQRDVSSPLKG